MQLGAGKDCLTFAIASVTAASCRPLMITSAPICASPVAEASPMPRVEPVTSASFPVRSKFMSLTPEVYVRFELNAYFAGGTI